MPDQLQPLFARLAAQLPDGILLVGEAIPERFYRDWSSLPPVRPEAVALPRSTEQVALILAYCTQHKIPVVPQGGLTGLAGGARPISGSLAMNLSRMSAIEDIDLDMATVTVQAGATLQDVQLAVDSTGMMLTLDLGARGSCLIGGNIATNAGGNRVIRYGMARDHVLGLEFVLSDGTVVTSLNKMLKNNAGYDLKQFMIGSEGTLGIITRAVLRLQPKPATLSTALCSCPDYPAVLDVLRNARRLLGPSLTAFEVMWPSFYETMSEGLADLRRPLGGVKGLHVLIESTGFDPAHDRGRFESFLEQLLESGAVSDAVLAETDSQTRDLWAVRESVSEYGRVLGPIIAFDIGLPTTGIGHFVEEVGAAIRQKWADAFVLCYGHIGDSNLHVVAHVPSAGSNQPEHAMDDLVYAMVAAAGGTISAEHGIGLLKKPYLDLTRSETERAVMKRIKHALDPDHILNPGKVFDR